MNRIFNLLTICFKTQIYLEIMITDLEKLEQKINIMVFLSHSSNKQIYVPKLFLQQFNF